MLEHRVEYDEQLAHASCEGQLLRLTSGQQPLVEVPDDRVVAAGDQRSHVQGSADPGASAPDGAFYGNIDHSGDTDRVRVFLTSGTTYTIEVRSRKGVDRSLRCTTVTGIYHTDGNLVSADTSIPSRFF